MPEHKTGRVLSVGRLYCDLIFTGMDKLPELGKEQFAQGLSMHTGGGAYITAAYLASLDRPVSLLSSLPCEPFLSMVQQEIQSTSIDVSACEAATPPGDPQITIAMALCEDRAFLTRRTGPALPAGPIPWEQWPDINHLHVGELTTLIEHPELIRFARDRGISISLDPSWDDKALSSSESVALINQVDVFLPNEIELKELKRTGYQPTDTPICVVKQGSAGACLEGGKACASAKAQDANLIDTTGAGDAFNAGFIDAWLAGHDIQQCLQAGTACGAMAVAKMGGTP